jgi:hypothetical protein
MGAPQRFFLTADPLFYHLLLEGQAPSPECFHGPVPFWIHSKAPGHGISLRSTVQLEGYTPGFLLSPFSFLLSPESCEFHGRPFCIARDGARSVQSTLCGRTPGSLPLRTIALVPAPLLQPLGAVVASVTIRAVVGRQLE